MDPFTVMASLAALQAVSSGVSSHSQKKAAEKYAKASGKKVDLYRTGQKELIDKLTKHFPSHKLNFEEKGLYKGGYNYLKDLLSNDPKSVEAFQKPYLRQFREDVVPEITQRYSEFGEGGLQSSGFQNALAQASQGLQENLAQMRSGMQMQALPQSLQYLQAPAQSYYNRASLGLGGQGLAYQTPLPPQPGFWGGFGGGMGQGISNIASMYAMNQLLRP